MNQQQAGQPRLTPEDQETAVLLSLAYLGQITLTQLARLLLTSERTIQRRLTQDADSLVKRGLIARIDRAGGSDESGMPTRGVAWWRLTEEGHRSIRTHAQYPSNNLGHDEQYPARPAAIRKGRLEHDAMVAETVVCLVEAARAQGSGLSGVFARLELKLNPFHSAPWADALVVCHTTQGDPGPHPIPWTRNRPTGGDEVWAFVVELDRATEPLATIGGKAREYAMMMADQRWNQHWVERFGGEHPRLLWVVPSEQRGEQVQRVWQEIWPSGRWYIATPEQMRSNVWQRSVAGKRGSVTFFKQIAPATAMTGTTATRQAITPSQSSQGAASASTMASTAPSAAPVAPQPAMAGAPGAAREQSFRVGLLLTSLTQSFAPSDRRVQLLDEAGRVVSEATTHLGRARFALVVPERAVRLRLPELQVEVKLGPGRDSIDLQMPEPPPPAPTHLPGFERLPSEAPRQWGDAGFERAIDRAYFTCNALAERVNKQADSQMQAVLSQGSIAAILLNLLFAYLSIFPLGFCFTGQALCVLLRGLVRLGRAVGWMLGTVWENAWGKPKQRALAVLARTLLALTFVVWLPLASWDYYDGELRSWPCRARTERAIIWAFTEPSQDAEVVQVKPKDKLHCFTRIVQDDPWLWRRVQLNGHESWVEDRLVEAQQSQ